MALFWFSMGSPDAGTVLMANKTDQKCFLWVACEKKKTKGVLHFANKSTVLNRVVLLF